MTISFKSKTKNINSITNKKQTSLHENDIQKKIISSNELKNVQFQNNNSQALDSKIISKSTLSENSLDIEKTSSKNLADFFNGQIVDTEKE